MTYLVSNRVSSRISFIAVGVGLILLTNARAVRAVDLDIPQIQARAERGSIQQQIKLGAAYFTGRGVAQDNKQAAYWYEKAANAGDPYAQKQIGFFYQAGIGVPRDPARAAQWFQRAAAGGLVNAKTNLGVAYLWGIGVPRDTPLAMQLFHEALAKRDGSAGFSLGEMYYFGIGVAKDPVAAQHWYELGAKLHDPLSQFRVGVLMERNQPGNRKLKKAAGLLRASASAGYVLGKQALGLLLVNHPELPQSPNEAILLLEDAAAAGAWRSSLILGILARDGIGMPADPAAAYYHFRVAVLQGGEQAARPLANDLRTLSARLGPEQTQAKDAEAAAWFQKHRLALEFVYQKGEERPEFPAFALTMPDEDTHVGRLLPTPSF